MTCDDVFDVLTRGPFPSGGWEDQAVEAHLHHCPECHRLAVALRPAVELFQEAVGPDESRSLPGYRGQAGAQIFREGAIDHWGLGHDAVAQAERAFAPAPRVVQILPARSSLLKFAAAVLLGVAAAAGSRGLIERSAASAEDPPHFAANSSSETRDANRRWLMALKLPPACVRYGRTTLPTAEEDSPTGIQLAAVENTHLSCCTDCHASSTTGLLGQEARATVARACSACH